MIKAITTVYKANDGKKFFDEKKAIAYDIKKIKEEALEGVVNAAVTGMGRYAKKVGKYGMFVSWDDSDGVEEILKAAPYLDIKTIFTSFYTVLFFDTQAELEKHYYMTKDYKGNSEVYVTTCSNDGKLQHKRSKVAYTDKGE